MKQFTYIRIDSMWGKDITLGFFNCPLIILFAESLMEADKQFNQMFGVKISQLPHISVKWIEHTIGMK